MAQHDNVSRSIFSILAAYTNGLNVLKKLYGQKVKEERRKKTSKTTPERDGRKKDPRIQGQTKTTVHHDTVHHGLRHDDRRRKAENQLSNSLREGSKSIRREFDNGCEKAGCRFETGDVIAQASLTDTLLKLNTGLVGIISSFLDNGKKDFNLDLDKLTTISDQARSETLIALSDLYQRLSTTNFDSKGVSPVNNINLSRQSQYKRAAERQARGYDQIYQKRTSRQTVSNSKKKPMKTITIARVPIKNSSTKQLAIVRPRKSRQTSFSSSSSGNSRTSSGTAKSAVTTVTIPDPSLTKLKVSPRVHCHPAKHDSFKSGFSSPPEKEIGAPNYDGHEKKESQCNAELPIVDVPCKSKAAETLTINSESSNEPLYPRRTSRTTPSFYSIVTNSTKIGEIPFNKQVEPPNLELMDRLNSEATEAGYHYGQMAAEQTKPSGRNRFLPKNWSWKRRRNNSVAT